MAAYNESISKFADLDAQVVGISVDSPYSHVAWQEKGVGILNFPLACDFFPHGAVADSYGILRLSDSPLAGINERAVFVVDQAGRIAFAKLYHLGEQPDNEEVFEVLRSLQVQSSQLAAKS